MVWLKSCLRCGGDLYGDKDKYGVYIACIQCGHYLSREEERMVVYGFSRRLGVSAASGVSGEPVLVKV